MADSPYLILRCRSRSERTECERLAGVGVDAVCPTVVREIKRSHRLGSQHKRQVIRNRWPLISGLIYIPAQGSVAADMDLIHRCAAGERSKIWGYMAYAHPRGDQRPYRLPAAELERMVETAKIEGRRKSSLDAGDAAEVAIGALTGQTVTLIRLLPGDKRARVRAQLLGREVEAEVDLSALVKAED